MFDFERWCVWAEAKCAEDLDQRPRMSFSRGRPSAKKGASVAFETDRKLMQLSFWETGEADFYGVELPGGSDVAGFAGRTIDDSSFEQVFRDCRLACV